MSWLLDTDVICQPAKRHGDVRVIAWLHREKDKCFTSAIVIAQLAYWVRSKDRQRRELQDSPFKSDRVSRTTSVLTEA